MVFFLDPGSQTHILDSCMAYFWVKSATVLGVWAKKFSLPVQK
jgi:hypothetical protein